MHPLSIGPGRVAEGGRRPGENGGSGSGSFDTFVDFIDGRGGGGEAAMRRPSGSGPDAEAGSVSVSHAVSLGTGRIGEGGSLVVDVFADGPGTKMLRRNSWGGDAVRRRKSGQSQSQAGDDDDDDDELKEAAPSSVSGGAGGLQSVIGYEEPIVLTQSTHSFLFTEPVRSVPFAFAVLVIAVSYTCLILALYNEMISEYDPGNPVGVPVGVTVDVKIAQYLALLIGLIMEEEIPESLYLLRMINERTLRQREPWVKYFRFVLCGAVRIVMGALFHRLARLGRTLEPEATGGGGKSIVATTATIYESINGRHPSTV